MVIHMVDFTPLWFNMQLCSCHIFVHNMIKAGEVGAHSNQSCRKTLHFAHCHISYVFCHKGLQETTL